MKSLIPKLLVVAGLIVAGANVQAVPINGSIAFSGGVTVNNPLLGNATAILSYTGVGVTSAKFGDYASVPTGTPATFTPFAFQPNGSLPVGSLWTFTANGLTYSFTATSESAAYNGTLNAWNIGGLGDAAITGFDTTHGTWSLTLTQQGSSLAFASAAAAPVPDGGTTVLLLGAALSALGFIKRRFA